MGSQLGVAMNPEFLREGSAVQDFHDPDKLVIGTTQDWVRDTLYDLYADIIPDTTVVDTGIPEAEAIKYANNAFLATKVSFANELGNICKRIGVDTYEVADAMGLDHRIGASFLRSGLGWGGSCFPKDVDALRALARDNDYDPALLDAAVAVNDGQPGRLVDLLARHVELDGARIAVLGLAFKPGTDDVRKSRALDVIRELVDRGASPVAYDPVATANAKAALDDVDVEFVDRAADALEGGDGAGLTTDWDEFEALEFSPMANRVLVDGRRVDVDRDALDVYEGLCW
jgi:UDPglucose 6-dehydrogenase